MLFVQPTIEQQIQIQKAVNENVATRNNDIESMKEWLKKQPHLPDTIDDIRLLNFLRGCSFSLEKCKRKLDLYFTTKTAVPEIFQNRDISSPELRKILDYMVHVYLLPLTPDGKRVSITGATRTDFETPNIADCFKLISMMGDLRLISDEFGAAGDIIILDGKVGLSKHFMKVSPVTIKKFLIGGQESFPVKVKQVHLVNLTSFAEHLLNFAKPFLKEKIRRRIYFHHNLESLHQHVPKELLPEEYGGNAGKLKDLQDEWIRTLEEHTEWFKEQDNYKSDESKRPENGLNCDEIFGIEGSFKQLNID